MRIWDIEPQNLCRKHLLGEHRELHAIWSIITKNKKGYSRHPETLRWKGKLKALFLRHENLVKEFKRRGYNHKSPLPIKLATGSAHQIQHIDSIEKQIKILKNKGCPCFSRYESLL
ncbi:MAG: pyrimidine dimer DNA glycosylase/endonuclease V [Candidatus Omnitrophica bacterium]|nr:pyrimidine dimer DNA glycosylase/endonuclease V [Candidatus Omnitrophota bacterium]MCM8823590.1 pyrimidine dimer DNA glycosylase/endonuclease V [Candidatus Omnitrophota bacterium]MCM8826290.1 pyrimidine dimer DNA glycosylase/endonuclease V [Candidatus Omnitrophota bacterium]